MTQDKAFGRRLVRTAVVVVIVLAAGIAGMWLRDRGRLKRERAELERRQRLGPQVATMEAALSPTQRMLDLVGEVRPYAEVTLYAKVSGYLRHVGVDKGDAVRRGQLLAMVESPETDRDYEAALANAENLREIADRYPPLLDKKYVSEQETEIAFTNAEVAERQADALKILRNYEQIRAPFDGLVTARYADEGALIQAATGGQVGALPVFTVSTPKRLRVFVYVDQADAPFVHAGDTATLVAQERPDRPVQARLTRLAGELDPQTRTLLTEIDIDNRSGLFVPGSLLHVKLSVPAPRYVQIPTEALIVKGDKAFTAVVGPDSRLRYRQISIGDNDGVRVQVLSGLSAGQRVAINVGESIAPGSRVQIAGEPAQSSQGKGR